MRTKTLTAIFCFLSACAAAFSSSVSDYYDIETIPLPEGEFSADAVGFFPDGRLVCVTSMSTVWTYRPDTKEWSVFAEGLHTPLGLLPLSDTEVLVMQRPELTLLIDENGDGKADVFKTVSDDFGVSGNYSEFTFGPIRDDDGNLYIGLGTGSHFGQPLTNEVRGYYSRAGHWGRMNTPVPYRGWILKITPEGETIPFANGFREGNGFAFDPEGRIFGIDNQGDWVGTSSFYHIEKDGFYGHVPSLVWREDFWGGKMPLDLPVKELDAMRTRPAVMFPHGEMSNSPTQPIWDNTGGKFGPFAGQPYLGEMNFNRILRVMLEEVNGMFQGAVIPLIDDPLLNKGNNRLVFNPDGSLWVGQTKHKAWVGESGLQHITWKGVTPMEIKSMNVTEDGFKLTFTRELDRKSAERLKAYSINTYFYNYHEAYGSEKFDDKDSPITSVEVSEDRLSVTLRLETLEAWRLYDLTLDGIKSNDGHDLLNPWVVYTLNHLIGETPPPRSPIPVDSRKRRKPVLPKGGVKGIGGPQEF